MAGLEVGDMNRFFVVDAAAYESTRLSVDAALAMPQGETCLVPAADANKTIAWQVLVSVRVEHCGLEPYKSAIDSLLASNAGQEVGEADWLAMFPPVAWPPS